MADNFEAIAFEGIQNNCSPKLQNVAMLKQPLLRVDRTLNRCILSVTGSKSHGFLNDFVQC